MAFEKEKNTVGLKKKLTRSDNILRYVDLDIIYIYTHTYKIQALSIICLIYKIYALNSQTS